MSNKHTVEEKWRKNAKYLAKKLKQQNYKDIERHFEDLVGSAVNESLQQAQDEDRARIIEEVEKRLEHWASLEHDRWSNWQKYMHSKMETEVPDCGVILGFEHYRHWERQIATPYTDLTEKEKESDREQVKPYIDDIIKIIKD